MSAIASNEPGPARGPAPIQPALEAPALEAKGVAKSYGAVVALENGLLRLERGEVHVILGSNGCGKSTLCKIIAGSVPADGGEVLLEGRPVSFRSPHEGQAAGIATVYQETALVPTLSVAENIFLGQEPLKAGRRIDRQKLHTEFVKLAARVGTLAERLDPDTLVGDLSIDQQQIVEIIKALSRNPRIIIFDESTSSLDRSQVASFFALVRELKAQGVSMIFITHRMEEIFAIADRVTIMRNGRFIEEKRVSDTSREELVNLMVGNAAVRQSAEGRPARVGGKPVLVARGLSGGKAEAVDLEVRAGEIVGLGGLHGQGQSDTLLALYGGITRRAGQVSIDGTDVPAGTPASALKRGVVYISGDRGRAGALRGRPIVENLIVGILSKGRNRIAKRAELRGRVRPVIEQLKLKFGRMSDAIETLSGGNQQKVVVGRGLATGPTVLLLDDPTKGIDVQSKRDLFALISELCAGGMAVVLYSSEDMELLENSDRVLVFNTGHVVAEIPREELSEFSLNAASLKSAGVHA
ncbi:MAG: sugar ABC transporter ATP-binding protein [Mesorhizobium amorphae]|nr:MAG: sugar ABC transporter ATP-binding protein [Mesorhizobium amorphae]